ncbi:MAG: DUF1499 domain-containing protein [Sterolibacteriaceae bacterium]|uniref:DUF1499 domain-containing protein n=1 Tax=Candidatus Methylophosphatis roskildensis TaxID=2899263 RepID=A0A9D7HT25_9PROT|nr:DUF1499 domain-containing protein [Candidatus Methylophosphatis roskildensis]
MMTNSDSRHAGNRPTLLAWGGLILALAALLLGGAAGLGHRAGLWSYTSGFALMGVAALAGLAALVANVIAGLRIRRLQPRPPLRVAVLGGVLGAIVVSLPANQLRLGMSLPRIHDITTDTANPPPFVAIAPLRADSPNPSSYAGESVARQQLASYPQVVPHFYNANRHVVFNEAVEIVRGRGWMAVATDDDGGRIEASVMSRWFGFVDDVVIRVAETPQGTRVDMRSKSRVGQSDLGANAERVRTFLAELDQQLSY